MSKALANDVANLLEQCLNKDKEIERLNNIINELEEHIYKCQRKYKYKDVPIDLFNDILDKLQELKGSDKK